MPTNNLLETGESLFNEKKNPCIFSVQTLHFIIYFSVKPESE